MNYGIGERVSWRGMNRDYTGVVTGYHGPFAVVRIDGSAKCVLLQNEEPKKLQRNGTTIF